MLLIRRIQPQDMLPVVALAYDTLPERYSPSLFNQFYELFPEGFLVACDNDTLIGFLIGIKTTSKTARILMVAVQEDYRRQTIGSTLLTHFSSEMKKHHIISLELEVRTTNHEAIEFYKRQGFLIKATLQRFYQNGQDAYKMTKEL